MNPTVKSQWLARLADPEVTQATGYLHLAGGAFDCLGLLCDLYLQATLHLNEGQGLTAHNRINAIVTSRAALVADLLALGGPNIPANVALNLALVDLFTNDTITPRDKEQIKFTWDAIKLEQAIIDAECAPYPSLIPIVGQYDTAIEYCRLALVALTQPGGWDAATNDWRTDYTSVDTSAMWVRGPANTEYYSIEGYVDKLPEVVQVWSWLFTQDPMLEVTDAAGFAVPMHVFINKLNDGNIQNGADQSPRNYTLTEIAALIQAQL